MKPLRQLNDAGLAAFLAYIEAVRLDPLLAPPTHLLWDGDTSELIAPTVEIDDGRVFANRLTLAQYLSHVVEQLDYPELDAWSGMWSWVALLYFDQLCPALDGVRHARQASRYVLNDGSPLYDFRRSSRHLVFSPTWIYMLHPVRPPQCMLSQAVSVHPDMAEQLFSVRSLVSVRSVLQAADLLYFDGTADTMKRGATDRKGAGTVRRFVSLCSQLDLTYDLAQLQPSELIDLLPAEFDRWKQTDQPPRIA